MSIGPNDLDVILSSAEYDSEGQIEFVKKVLSEYVNQLDCLRHFLDIDLKPRVDNSSYEYKEIESVVNDLKRCKMVIDHFIDNDDFSLTDPKE